MNSELTFSIAGGIVLAIAALWLLNTLVEIPKIMRRRKQHREMMKLIDGTLQDLSKFVRRDMAERNAENAKRSSKKTKKTGGANIAKPTTRTSKARVPKAKKGV